MALFAIFCPHPLVVPGNQLEYPSHPAIDASLPNYGLHQSSDICVQC
jgi:hypothetical protein